MSFFTELPHVGSQHFAKHQSRQAPRRQVHIAFANLMNHGQCGCALYQPRKKKPGNSSNCSGSCSQRKQIMNLAILNVNSKVVTMSSLEMADLAEKRHDNVRRVIWALVEQGVISHPQIEFGPQSANGVAEKVLLVGKRDSYIVMAQLSPEFTARLVDRWQELEAKQSTPVELSRMDILTLAIESEKGRLLAIEQRDHAINTKAQIGDKRQATSMAKVAVANREVTKLKALIGESTQGASVVAVENAMKRKFGAQDWRKLKSYCITAGLGIGRSFNPGMQLHVNTYPAAAWLEVFGVDLVDLFGEVMA